MLFVWVCEHLRDFSKVCSMLRQAIYMEKSLEVAWVSS